MVKRFLCTIGICIFIPACYAQKDLPVVYGQDFDPEKILVTTGNKNSEGNIVLVDSSFNIKQFERMQQDVKTLKLMIRDLS